MDLKQLRYLVEIAKHRSMTLASKRIFISQPTISNALKNLEEELGVELFIRNKSGISMTPFGQEVVVRAKSILEEVGAIQSKAQIAKKPANVFAGTLMIYTVSSINHTILPDILEAYKRQYPHVSFNVIETDLEEIVIQVQRKKNSIALVAIENYIVEHYQLDSVVNYVPLVQERMFVYAAKNSPIFKYKSISMKKILAYPLVIYDVNTWADESLRPYGKANVLLKSNDMALGFKMVAESHAVGFASNMVINKGAFFDSSLVSYIPIENQIQYYIGYMYSKEKELEAPLLEFINIFKFHLNSI
ncbi:MAG: LysR family transcriptional regulator [Gracilibacteraceae bacterium]|jgi:DNA-binding transcriptional LysR family regulator|nr:LysR family transcriptional regulator [Gracilibacteraceae bacterium]